MKFNMYLNFGLYTMLRVALDSISMYVFADVPETIDYCILPHGYA